MAKLPCIPQSRIFTLKETGETMSYDQVRQYLMSNPELWLGKGEAKEIKKEEKSTEFGKALSASSRFKPKELVVFDTPIVGPNGNKLVAYQWAYEWTMKENKEGELVDKRISDWTQAESSAETGRDVVHKFTVQKTDGSTVTVSSETIPSLLGYVDAKQMKGLPSVVSAVKTLAKQRMQLAIMEAQEAEYKALEEKFEKADKPEVKEVADPAAERFGINKEGELTTYGMGDVSVRQDNRYNWDTKKFDKVPLSKETIEQLERRWVKKRIEEAGGKYPSNITDLRNRVKRQERRVEEATNSKITIKEQEGEKAEGKKADPIIEALEKGKIKGAAGMNIAVWNAAIDTIKAAYIAGKALAEAINEGIAYLKSKGEDVSKYQDALDDIRKAEKTFPKSFTKEGGNKIVDSKGDPLKVYHGTTIKDFVGGEFIIGWDVQGFSTGAENLGVFFGNKKQARQISEGAVTYGATPETEKVVEVYINLKNPLRLTTDAKYWFEPYRVLDALKTDGRVNVEELTRLVEEHEKEEKIYTKKPANAIEEFEVENDTVAQIIRPYLEEKGFDGIIYDNQVDAVEKGEKDSGVSYIVFNPKNILPIFSVRLDETPETAKRSEKPRVATFFSGAGTIEAALPESESVMAVEYSPTYMKAYNDAFGTKYEARDVTQINPQEVKAANPDIFHASPVCKNFSKAKNINTVEKSDMDSAESVAKVIREAKPPVVTIENVPGYKDTVPFNAIIKALEDAGYTYDVGVYNAADFGGSQNRNRLFVRAVRDGKLPAVPSKKKQGDWYKAVEDLIDDAPDAPFTTKTREKNWEQERIDEMIADGRLDPSKPIITMGASAYKGEAAATNAGNPSPTLLSSSAQVPRIIMPDGRVKRVTPEMMKRLMDLPLSYPVPADAKVAKEVLGNGMDGAFTKALIEPLIKPVKEEDRVEKFLKDLYWKEGGLGMNVGLWNAAVTTMLKAYRAGKTVYEAIQAGIDFLIDKKEDIKEYQSLIDKATDALKKDADKQGREIGTPPTAAQPQQKKAATPPPTTTEGAELPETPEGQVPKKVVERRYKADSPEMQQALEEIGLFRTPGNINEAQAAANALVRKVGVDAALEVAEKETIDGLYKIGIIGAALDDIEARRNATNDYEEFIRLTNEAARVTAMGGKFLTTAGQELRMWQEILRSQTLPFEYEARKKAFVEQFGQEAFTKEVQERFESLDKQLKEALAKVNELEEQKAAWERQSVIDSLAEQKPEPPASRKSFFKEAAARVRKLIVSKPGIFSAATPASLAWDASIEAVAVALEGLGTLEIAIGKGLDKLRSTEWYRKLSQSKKDEAEKAFKESVEKAYIPEITVDDNGKVVIPQGALKAYVEAGYRDAEEIVDNIYNKLSSDNPNLTKRDVRDAISGYGRSYNPTPNQVRDQINEIKAIGRLISAIEDAENGIEKTTNPKTKKQISDRLKALEEQYEAAYINSFGRKPTQPSEATRYATVKRNLEKEIERLRAMKPRPERRPPVDYDAQLEALATEKFRLQEEWDAEFAKEEWRQKKWWEIVGDVAYASTQLPKSMMAGGLDLGMLTIQASLMSMTDAKLTGKAFKALGKSLWSEKEYQKEIAKIRNSELYRIIRKSGLDMSTPVGLSGMAEEVGTDTLAEGLFNLMISWMKYIPKYGPKSYEIAKRFNFIRALNRAQVAYMNTLKVGTFLIDMQNMKEKGITFYNNPKAYKEAADAINVMSGRSKLFGAERSKVVMRGLNIAIFSPRNWASILRLFTPWLLVEIATKRAGADPYKMSVSQARIVKNMAKYVAGTALLMYAIKAMTSDDDEDEEKKRERGNVSIDWENPQSSAFNKIRIGNQILDPWGGKMQIITLQARLLIHAMGGYAYKDPYTGIEKKLEDSYFKTPGGLIGEYIKGKFAPSLRAPWQLANSVAVPGRPGWYRPIEGGKEFYIFEPFKESFENLTIQAVKETYGEQPLTLSEITALMIIAGTGSTLLNDQEDLTTVTKIRNLLSPGEDEIKKFKKAFANYLEAGDYEMAENVFDKATGTYQLYQNLQLQQEMGKPTSEAKKQLDRKRKQSIRDLFGGIQEDNLVQKYSFEKKYRDEIIDAVYKDKTLSTYGMSEKKAKMFERINALTPEMKEDIKRNYDLQYEELMTVAKGLDKVAERADHYYEKRAKNTPWVRQYLRLTGKGEKK